MLTKYPGRLTSILLPLFAAGCQDTARPGAIELGLDQVTATYLCGNRFELTNQSSSEKLLQYLVVGTAESGEVVLPAASSTGAAVTRLTTLTSGPLQISIGEEHGPLVTNGSVS